MTDTKKQKLATLAAFDIEGGIPRPVQDLWPSPKGDFGYRWLHLDLNDPALEAWAHEHLPPIASHALLQSETRPRCERSGDGLILNLRGVNLNPDSDPEDMVSLRMWITADGIVSTRKRKIWALDAIRQAAEEGKAPETIGRFLADVTHGLTTRIETVSLDLEDQTDEMEQLAVEGEFLTAGQLASMRQAVIKMRRFIHPQREAVAMLAALEDWIITSDDNALLRESSNRTRRIVEEIDATRDRLSTLQDHIKADRDHALSRNSYVLSIVAAIFLPLSFLTGLFGVNVGGMPGIAAPYAFWALSAVSLIGGIALFLIFKFAKWL